MRREELLELLTRLAGVFGRQQDELAERAASRSITLETPKRLVGWPGTLHPRPTARPPAPLEPTVVGRPPGQDAVATPNSSPLAGGGDGLAR
jgi:hypothetical protein